MDAIEVRDEQVERAAWLQHPQRLSERVRAAIRARQYSRRTEQSYLHWIRRFWMFGGRRDPASLAPTWSVSPTAQ